MHARIKDAMQRLEHIYDNKGFKDKYQLDVTVQEILRIEKELTEIFGDDFALTRKVSMARTQLQPIGKNVPVRLESIQKAIDWLQKADHNCHALKRFFKSIE